MDAATKAEVQASCPRTTLESAIRKPGGTILVTKSKPMTLSATQGAPAWPIITAMSPILVMPSIAKRAYVFRSASFYNLEFSVLVQFDLD
jgi:hypothetical protein